MSGVEADLARRLREAVSARRGELIELTCELVRERSLNGNEEGAQRLVEEQLRALGFAVERVPVTEPEEDDGTWGYPPLPSYEGRTCVGGRCDR